MFTIGSIAIVIPFFNLAPVPFFRNLELQDLRVNIFQLRVRINLLQLKIHCFQHILEQQKKYHQVCYPCSACSIPIVKDFSVTSISFFFSSEIFPIATVKAASPKYPFFSTPTSIEIISPSLRILLPGIP